MTGDLHAGGFEPDVPSGDAREALIDKGLTRGSEMVAGSDLDRTIDADGRGSGATVRVVQPACSLALQEQARLARRFDEMASTVWGIGERFFRDMGTDLFTRDDLVVVATERGVPIAFSIYRVVPLVEASCLFQRYTCVDKAYMRSGLYTRMSEAAFSEIRRMDNGTWYLAWRTRNPILWFKNVGFCSSVVPVFEGDTPAVPSLALSLSICAKVYPNMDVDPNTMVVKDVYPGETGYREQPRHSDPRLDGLFFSKSMGDDEHGSLFGLGVLRA